MADSYFTRLDESADAGHYIAGPYTAGPWAAHLQHGGPPNALAVTAAERAVTAATHRTDLHAMRFAADFVGPVPLGEITTAATVVRAARSAALVEVLVAAQGRDCLRVRVWFVRVADTTAVATPGGEVADVPTERGDLGMDFGYANSLDWRFTVGSFTTPGPAAAWVAPTMALVGDDGATDGDTDSDEVSGLARVALVADSASGISAELDWSTWSFANVDLDVHLLRPMRGPWLHMAARTLLGPTGTAVAQSSLRDRDGSLGVGLQTLVVAPIPTS